MIGLTGCVEDVTASVQSRSELEVKAISDPLTGCLNRAGTLAVLQETLDRSPALGGGLDGTAALFIDLEWIQAGERRIRPRHRR